MKVYLVGGAVRDNLLGVNTQDYDYVVVGATFEELRAIYGEPVGLDFPVFLDKATGDQYAMARRERKVGVGYHGFTCEFGNDVTLAEDLSRRDLTINALAKDVETGEIVDCFGGLQDLETKTLRHVSEAFSEDPLRVVRLARFAARYSDFKIDPETRVLANQIVNSGEMDNLPYERYWLELEKAVMDDNVGQFMRVMSLTGAFTKIEFFNMVWGDFDVVNTLSKIERVSKHLRHAPEDLRLSIFVALTCRPDFALPKAAPTRMFEIFAGMKRIQRMLNLQVEPLYELLKTAKAFSQATLIDDIVMALEIYNAAGYTTAIFPAELRELMMNVRAITSEPFQHLNGKEIGVAMEKARKQAIENTINQLED